MRNTIKKAVLPVAGFGTRFLPATKVVPKEMLTIVEKPVIQYAVEEARAAGIEKFIFVTSRGKSALEDYFDQHFELYETLRRRSKEAELALVRNAELPPGSFSFVRQAEPLGLGHAIWCARYVIDDEPFAVLLPDEVFLCQTPLLKQMMDVYDDVGGNILATREVASEMASRYGILDVERDDGRLAKVRGLVEKPKPGTAPSNLSIVGRYILQPEVFGYLDRHNVGAGGEIQLTDALFELVQHQPLHGVRFEGQRFDCGSKVGFVAANVAFALEHPDMADRMRVEIKQVLEGRHL